MKRKSPQSKSQPQKDDIKPILNFIWKLINKKPIWAWAIFLLILIYFYLYISSTKDATNQTSSYTQGSDNTSATTNSGHIDQSKRIQGNNNNVADGDIIYHQTTNNNAPKHSGKLIIGGCNNQTHKQQNIVVRVGSDKIHVSESLTELILLKAGDINYFTLRRVNCDIFIDALVYSNAEKIVAKIEDNKFTLNPNEIFDYSNPSNQNQLKVIDNYNKEVLFVDASNSQDIITRGQFNTPQGVFNISKGMLTITIPKPGNGANRTITDGTSYGNHYNCHTVINIAHDGGIGICSSKRYVN